MIGKFALTILDIADDLIPDNLIPTDADINRIEKRATQFVQVTDALYKQLAKANRVQYYEWAGEIITDVVIQHYALKVAGKFASASELVVNAAERIAKGERIFEPLQEIGKETAQVIGLSAEHGAEIVQETIKVSVSEKELATKGQSFFQEVEKNLSKRSGLNPGRLIQKFDRQKVYAKYTDHIFSSKHIDKGIMKLGKTKKEIFNKLVDIIKIADKQSLLKLDLTNQIRTCINGMNVEIHVHIIDGKVMSVDAFIGSSKKNFGNIINIL